MQIRAQRTVPQILDSGGLGGTRKIEVGARCRWVMARFRHRQNLMVMRTGSRLGVTRGTSGAALDLNTAQESPALDAVSVAAVCPASTWTNAASTQPRSGTVASESPRV